MFNQEAQKDQLFRSIHQIISYPKKTLVLDIFLLSRLFREAIEIQKHLNKFNNNETQYTSNTLTKEYRKYCSLCIPRNNHQPQLGRSLLLLLFKMSTADDIRNEFKLVVTSHKLGNPVTEYLLCFYNCR